MTAPDIRQCPGLSPVGCPNAINVALITGLHLCSRCKAKLGARVTAEKEVVPAKP